MSFSWRCKRVHSRTGHEGPEGKQRYSSTLCLTPALDGSGWSTPRPARLTPGKDPVPTTPRPVALPPGKTRYPQRLAPSLYPRERPGTHCIEGWVGARAGLDGCGKSRLPPGFDPWTVQPYFLVVCTCNWGFCDKIPRCGKSVSTN